jgi:hypothetical protein
LLKGRNSWRAIKCESTAWLLGVCVRSRIFRTFNPKTVRGNPAYYIENRWVFCGEMIQGVASPPYSLELALAFVLAITA